MDMTIVLDNCILLFIYYIYIYSIKITFFTIAIHGLAGSSFFYDVAKKLANQGQPREA
jgi:hypothetical protein